MLGLAGVSQLRDGFADSCPHFSRLRTSVVMLRTSHQPKPIPDWTFNLDYYWKLNYSLIPCVRCLRMGRNARLSTLAGGEKATKSSPVASTDTLAPVTTTSKLERLPPDTQLSPEKPARQTVRLDSTAAPPTTPRLHRRVASHSRPSRNLQSHNEPEETAPLYVLVTTYLSYLVLILFGHLRDFFGKIFRAGEYAYLKTQNVRAKRSERLVVELPRFLTTCFACSMTSLFRWVYRALHR